MDCIDKSLETPLLYSSHISRRLGVGAYLKLENLQPSQSFKYRGISLFTRRCKAVRGDDLHVIVASGGNAGIVAACVANKLGIKCTVFIPDGASPDTINYLGREGSKVVIGGDHYLQALRSAEDAVAANPHAVLVPAYDHPTLWEGHGSMVAEISQQLGRKPDMIICSVGGGGLLGGVMIGCKAVGWEDVPIVTIETSGANCFYSSMALNKDWAGSFGVSDEVDIVTEDGVKIVHLRKLTSRATSLAATFPSTGVIKMALARGGDIRCLSVPDEMTMSTAYSFAEEYKMLIELACAATLTPAYEPGLMERLSEGNNKPDVVVFIVCGGFKISLNEIKEYRTIVQRELEAEKNDWECGCNGEKWNVPKTASRER
ncbi:tryptophan synthase beta subunit-like PLP-dependent enzyme, partial [Thelephora ganbajun]